MTAHTQETLLKQASYASVAVAVTLIIVKTVVYLLSDSVGVLASLVDSSMDAITSVINLMAVHYALKPADNEHRFGHGKAEDLSGLAQAAFILGSAVFLLLNAVDGMLHPIEVKFQGWAIGVMVFSILLTFALVVFQRYVVKKTQSTAIAGDSLHFEGDLWMNLAVIVGLVFALYGIHQIDVILGFCIAIYIIVSAVKLGLSASNRLMDVDLGEDVRSQIREIVDTHSEVLGLHELRTRRSGRISFIQFHLELDGNISLQDAHSLSNEIEAHVMAAIPNAEVIIHQDPAPKNQEELQFRR